MSLESSVQRKKLKKNVLSCQQQLSVSYFSYVLRVRQEINSQITGATQLPLTGQIVGVTVAAFTNMTGLQGHFRLQRYSNTINTN